MARDRPSPYDNKRVGMARDRPSPHDNRGVLLISGEAVTPPETLNTPGCVNKPCLLPGVKWVAFTTNIHPHLWLNGKRVMRCPTNAGDNALHQFRVNFSFHARFSFRALVQNKEICEKREIRAPRRRGYAVGFVRVRVRAGALRLVLSTNLSRNSSLVRVLPNCSTSSSMDSAVSI